MKKKIILLALLYLLIAGCAYLYYNPIVLRSDKRYAFIFNPKSLNDTDVFDTYYDIEMFCPTDTLKLFEHFDFSEGNWKVCILFHERYDVAKSIPKGKYLETKNIEIIRKLQNLTFEYTGGDICTLENELMLCKDNRIVFRCEVALDNNEVGFQSYRFGWIKSLDNQLAQLVSEFQRPMIPIVFL